jgi:type I restriction enzyme S subunit
VPFCPITKDNHQKYRLADGDIVVARTGNSTGENFLFKGNEDAVFASYLIRFRIDRQKADPQFVWYNLRSRNWWEFIDKSKTGSAQAGANAKVLGRFPVNLPPIEEQRAIAHILGTFDDRIELNRRMNQTLEEMARALFKSYFVDFDGVAAEDMQESELGLIPKGWTVRPLDSIANFLNGLALQKFPPESETEYLPVIKIAQLRAGKTDGADKASTQLKSEYIVEDGDVLFSWSGSLEVEVLTGGRGALNQHLFKVTSQEVPKWFYFFATRCHLPDFRAIAAGKATTMGHIQRKHLTDAKVVMPPPDAMPKFDSIIAPLFEQIIKNAVQSQTLAALRDTLLPKLISGELRLSLAA